MTIHTRDGLTVQVTEATLANRLALIARREAVLSDIARQRDLALGPWKAFDSWRVSGLLCTLRWIDEQLAA